MKKMLIVLGILLFLISGCVFDDHQSSFEHVDVRFEAHDIRLDTLEGQNNIAFFNGDEFYNWCFDELGLAVFDKARELDSDKFMDWCYDNVSKKHEEPIKTEAELNGECIQSVGFNTFIRKIIELETNEKVRNWCNAQINCTDPVDVYIDHRMRTNVHDGNSYKAEDHVLMINRGQSTYCDVTTMFISDENKGITTNSIDRLPDMSKIKFVLTATTCYDTVKECKPDENVTLGEPRLPPNVIAEYSIPLSGDVQ